MKMVSIIIPAYNEEDFIEKSITACLAQEYPSFEIILVDNNCSDKTVEIAGKFPVRIVHEKRKGLLYARACGAQNAKGEILANIDADCIPEKDWLSKGVLLFSNGDVSGVSGPYDYYDASLFFRYSTLWSQQYIHTFLNYILSRLGIGALARGGNVFVRKSALEKAGGYNSDIEFWGEDTETAKRLAKVGKFIFSMNLIMKTSARRFKREGFLILTFKYQYYLIKILISKIKLG